MMSTGTLSAHGSKAFGQRGWKEQPVGIERWSGGEPGMPAILARYRKARNGRAVPGEQAQLNTLVSAAGRSKAAERVLDETAGYLGAGIANLINLFNPERIVLSGWAGLALGDALLPRIREEAAAHALRHPYGQTLRHGGHPFLRTRRRYHIFRLCAFNSRANRAKPVATTMDYTTVGAASAGVSLTLSGSLR
jgi:hypothetical protein